MGKNKSRNWGSNKKKAGDGAKKILTGVAFMAACFFAVYVLMAFNDLIWLVIIAFLALMAAAYFFLGQIFGNTEEQIDDLLQAQEALEAVKEEDRKAADAAFKRQVEEQMKSMDRTTRAMFMTMKKSAEAQAIQLANMEKRIDKSIDEQNAGIKTIIKYNKENARQMAKSEKDALEKMAASISDELKTQSRNQAQPAVQYVQMPMAQPMYQQPIMQDTSYVPNPAPSPLPASAASPVAADEQPVAEITEEMPDIPAFDTPEEVVEETPAFDIPEEVVEEAPAFDIPEEVVEEAPAFDIPEEVVEEAPAFDIPEEVEEEASEDGLLSEDEIAAMLSGVETEESAPAEDPVISEPAPTSEADLAAATGVDLSDPNASLSADDIAKLFAAAGNSATVSPEPEEEKAEEIAVDEPAPAATSEADLAAATGVDLSDPNASLSADDIAKLFAAAGN